MIDDYDIDKVELYSLRRQIGIVPQEPLLFSGSVSENITLTDPNATNEDIAAAAESLVPTNSSWDYHRLQHTTWRTGSQPLRRTTTTISHRKNIACESKTSRYG